MTRTRYQLLGGDDAQGIWVGPGPHPFTGARLFSARFASHFDRGSRLERALAFARYLYEPGGPGSWLRDQARRDLRGHVLLTRDAAHGLTLSHAADDLPLEGLLELLPDVVCETRSLFHDRA